MAVGDDVRRYVENSLLSSFQMESEASVRSKVCDTIAELAKHMLSKGSMFQIWFCFSFSFSFNNYYYFPFDFIILTIN